MNQKAKKQNKKEREERESVRLQPFTAQSNLDKGMPMFFCFSFLWNLSVPVVICYWHSFIYTHQPHSSRLCRLYVYILMYGGSYINWYGPVFRIYLPHLSRQPSLLTRVLRPIKTNRDRAIYLCLKEAYYVPPTRIMCYKSKFHVYREKLVSNNSTFQKSFNFLRTQKLLAVQSSQLAQSSIYQG